MKPIFIVFGLVIGAMLGAWLATQFGSEYVAQQSFESPDEQGNLYQTVFLGSASICAFLGVMIGWIFGILLSGKDD